MRYDAFATFNIVDSSGEQCTKPSVSRDAAVIGPSDARRSASRNMWMIRSVGTASNVPSLTRSCCLEIDCWGVGLGREGVLGTARQVDVYTFSGDRASARSNRRVRWRIAAGKLMTWDAGLTLVGDRSRIKLSATDACTHVECGRFLALKVRDNVAVAGWKRRFGPWGVPPFPLRIIRDLVCELHGGRTNSEHAEMSRWLTAELAEREVHRLLRPFVRHAVDNLVEAHHAVEDELGELALVRTDPIVPPNPTAKRRLTAWAPVYATLDGRVREIRRYRLGAACPMAIPDGSDADPDVHWDTVAAFVTAAPDAAGVLPERVRVVEFGCLDGSIAVRFDGTPQQATLRYKALTQPRAAELVERGGAVPCSSCGDCKAAGRCAALPRVDGMLGHDAPGLKSRSVSPTELEAYRRCPGRWLLRNELHLPSDDEGSVELRRGNIVHTWLEHAHLRGIPCTEADLLGPSSLGSAQGFVTVEDLELVRPYLIQHLASCPLDQPDVTDVAVEVAIRGFDGIAQAIPTLRPDLRYKHGRTIVIREVKTSQFDIMNTREDAFARYLQIPFAIQMLNCGLRAEFGAETAVVELEMLTPNASQVWTWDAADPVVATAAAQAVADAAVHWHTDTSWLTSPGDHCRWCPVRRWCPDRDAADLLGQTGRADDGRPPVYVTG